MGDFRPKLLLRSNKNADGELRQEKGTVKRFEHVDIILKVLATITS